MQYYFFFFSLKRIKVEHARTESKCCSWPAWLSGPFITSAFWSHAAQLYCINKQREWVFVQKRKVIERLLKSCELNHSSRNATDCLSYLSPSSGCWETAWLSIWLSFSFWLCFCPDVYIWISLFFFTSSWRRIAEGAGPASLFIDHLLYWHSRRVRSSVSEARGMISAGLTSERTRQVAGRTFQKSLCSISTLAQQTLWFQFKAPPGFCSIAVKGQNRNLLKVIVTCW